MLFGRLASNADWLVENLKIEQNLAETISTDGFAKLRAEQLIFSRWVQVVYRFEREMYKNPEQDLNSLWWNLVKKYQEITKPIGRNSADWASKIHIALYPAYYHNYILGEILASQLHFFITEKVITNDNTKKSFSKDKTIGDYLKNLYFSYGALYEWNKLIEKAIGEKLNPKYYAKQFTY
jgi:peptidyl-dipeptidase A